MKNVTKKRLEMVRKEFKKINDLILALEDVLGDLKSIRDSLNTESKRLLKLLTKGGKK